MPRPVLAACLICAALLPAACGQEPTSGGVFTDTIPNGVTVPDVVGQDSRTAARTVRRAGARRVREEDATGAGRPVPKDGSWKVVSQSPDAGAIIPPATPVTVRSKAPGEKGAGEGAGG